MSRIFWLIFAMLPLAFAAPPLAAQDSFSYAVIDGTQTPPQILFSDANIQISDGGAGYYTLTFDTAVVFLVGTSMSRGPGFDVGPTFLGAVRNSSDRRQVNIGIYGIPVQEDVVHGRTDALFSIKFITLSPLIFENGFE